MNRQLNVSNLFIVYSLACLLISQSLNVETKIPLTCADLVYDNVFTLSHAGSQHYLSTDENTFGLGSLSYRQFSDWNPGGPVFDQIATLSNISTIGYANDYSWRPDYATWSGTVDQQAVRQQVGYTGQDSILGLMVFGHSQSKQPLTFSGQLSSKLDTVAIEKLHGGNQAGVKVTLTGSSSDPWGKQKDHIRLTAIVGFNVTANRATVTIDSKNRKYTVSILPSSSTSDVLAVSFSIALTNNLTDYVPSLTTTLYADPYSSTTDTINKWLSSVEPPPSTFSNHQLRVYYNAWFQFWYNMEHQQGNWTHNIITPSKSTYGRGIWLWDTGFHVLALVHGGSSGVSVAEDQIRVLVQGESVVGHLPREVWENVVGNDIQPPGILTWAALAVYNKSKSVSFLSSIYNGLCENNVWYYNNTDSNHDGLCEWSGGQSGWDTSPRWDHGPVEAVDLNCWLYLDQVYLAEMARILGKSNDREKWLKKAKTTAGLIQQNLYSTEDKLFFDRLPKTKQFVKVITPVTYWTMLVGIATQQQAEAMLKLYHNSSQLGTPYPMPCVGRSSPKFNPTNYWRGPTWINVNWLALLGWERYGFHTEADSLRNSSIALIGSHPVPREYYNPLTGGGLGAENYMWTGALYIVMIRERMQGRHAQPNGEGYLLRQSF